MFVLIINSKLFSLKEFIKIPIIEIITATANYAKTVTLHNKIGVWATNATISSNKYQEALSDVVCYGVKASDLVELIEEKDIYDTDNRIVGIIIR